MWHVGGTWEMQGFDGGDCKKRTQLEDLGIGGGIILEDRM